MIKKNFCIFIFLMILGWSAAAQDNMAIHGTTPLLYLSHTIAAKENWYSLGRMYNLSPKDIATYNRLSIDKPLEISQAVKIPLNSVNFSQNESKGAGEVFVPLYHVVQEKEWLYRISVNHNKVPVENLEKWNSITSDGAKPGMKLVVGYLKVKQANATLAGKAVAPATEPAAAEQKKIQSAKKDMEPKPELPKKVAEVASVESKKPDPPADNTATPDSRVSVGSANKGGYFKIQYEENGKNASGLSGIFKSTSGWNDGKYYALMNKVAIGAIVKIFFPSTNKTVYAKVLGELPDMKESAGLALRISDAAASELGVVAAKFSVEVKY